MSQLILNTYNYKECFNKEIVTLSETKVNNLDHQIIKTKRIYFKETCFVLLL